MSAVLLVRLKIPDLTALTALDAGRALVPEGYELTRLVREELYLFEPSPGADPAGFEPSIAKQVETSNFFVNPNKEGYRFLRSGERGPVWDPPEGSWGILARSRGDTRDAGLVERLMREHPLRGLGSIRRGRVWWLKTRSRQGDDGARVGYAALGPVVDAGHGLLVNPHSEAALRLEGATAWSRIEAFLAEPAPAVEREPSRI
ncbi:MAG TPA: hypothetical protein VK123_11230 [Candidatus Limnocylindrales bacterium]|nr:hypothetical protein [Candidatus Limnocylindrales bacterium]